MRALLYATIGRAIPMMASPQFSTLKARYPSPPRPLLQLRSEEARKVRWLVSLRPSASWWGNIVELGAQMGLGTGGGGERVGGGLQGI